MTAFQFVSPLSTPATLRGPNVTIVAMVAARAAQTPDAVALAAGGETLTYGELEPRQHLAAHGVGGEGDEGALDGLAGEVERSLP